MIIFTPEQLKTISDLADRTYPEECCGLLAGYKDQSDKNVYVTQVVISDNLSQSTKQDTFEVDPQVRFDLMRALEGSSNQIIGHFHSHPDHPARPSATDLSMVYEPELIWVIASVQKAKTMEIAAFKPHEDASRFDPLELSTQATHK